MKNEPTAEERDVLERFERGEMRTAPDAGREVELARQAARKTSDNRADLSRRLTEQS